MTQAEELAKQAKAFPSKDPIVLKMSEVGGILQTKDVLAVYPAGQAPAEAPAAGAPAAPAPDATLTKELADTKALLDKASKELEALKADLKAKVEELEKLKKPAEQTPPPKPAAGAPAAEKLGKDSTGADFLLAMLGKHPRLNKK